MNEESYTLKKTQEVYQYEFFSDGPNGVIRKIIQFQAIDGFDHLYNLAFGDWNEANGTIDDTITSNNGDRKKVLVTVARAVFEFMKRHPEATIFAQGSTSSRTRLYQMGISAFWNEINAYFNIDGYIDHKWEKFIIKRNYEAFLLSAK